MGRFTLSIRFVLVLSTTFLSVMSFGAWAITWPPLEVGRYEDLPTNPYTIGELTAKTEELLALTLQAVNYDRLAYLNTILTQRESIPHWSLTEAPFPSPIAFLKPYKGTNCVGFSRLFQYVLETQYNIGVGIVPAFYKTNSYFSHTAAVVRGIDGFVLFDPPVQTPKPIALSPQSPQDYTSFGTFELVEDASGWAIVYTNRKHDIVTYKTQGITHPEDLIGRHMHRRHDFPIVSYLPNGFIKGLINVDFEDKIVTIGHRNGDQEWDEWERSFDELTSPRDFEPIIDAKFSKETFGIEARFLHQRIWQAVVNQKWVENTYLQQKAVSIAP